MASGLGLKPRNIGDSVEEMGFRRKWISLVSCRNQNEISAGSGLRVWHVGGMNFSHILYQGRKCIVLFVMRFSNF